MKISEKVGSFQVTSSRILISDPCYENYSSRCSGIIEVPNGKWNAYYVRERNITKELTVVHSDYAYDLFFNWEICNFSCCVDSGQLGFYDWLEFNHQYDYDKFCDLTSSKIETGTNEYGVVTSSGYGDGDYKCYTYHEDNNVVAIKVVFDEEYEEEKDE